jgi:hypothetical protein
MLLVDPLSEVSLLHRALHVAIADSGHIVAMSKEGIGTLLFPDHTTAKDFDMSSACKAVALSPSGDFIAVVKQDALSLIALPHFREVDRLDGTFESCLFTGSLLWTVSRHDSETANLEVRETNDGAIRARLEIDDPFENSALMLFRVPEPDGVALWVAAGQDGQCLYWAHFTGFSIRAKRFPGLDDTTTAAFDPHKRLFLVVSRGDLHLYEYPLGPEVGRVPWPFDDDPAGAYLSFVGDKSGLVQTGEGRLFVIDLRKMEIAKEIAIQGHEPRPIQELYPELANESRLCSDLSMFFPLPAGRFLSVHRQLPAKSISDWRDQLVLWKIPL